MMPDDRVIYGRHSPPSVLARALQVARYFAIAGLVCAAVLLVLDAFGLLIPLADRLLARAHLAYEPERRTIWGVNDNTINRLSLAAAAVTAAFALIVVQIRANQRQKILRESPVR
jgi:hypothetical protein